MIEVLEGHNKAISYPIARKDRYSDMVVLFFGETDGVVIKKGSSDRDCGYGSSDWPRHDDSFWTPVQVIIKDQP